MNIDIIKTKIILLFTLLLYNTLQIDAQNITVPPPSCVYCNVTFRTGNESHLPSCPYYVASENYSNSSGSSSSNNPNIIDKIFKAIEERVKINQIKKAEKQKEEKIKEEKQNKIEAIKIALMYEQFYTINKIMNDKYKSEITKTATILRDRYVKLNSRSTITQLNCAAYNSLLSLQTSKLSLSDFENLESPLELSRKNADFSNYNTNDCPEITYRDYDVSIQQPIGSQEKFYQRIVEQTDSLKTVIVVLSEEKIKNDSVVKINEIKIKELKQTKEKIAYRINTQTDITQGEQNRYDKLEKAAMEELKSATEQLEVAIEKNSKVSDEYRKSYEKIHELEKSRQAYDKQNK